MAQATTDSPRTPVRHPLAPLTADEAGQARRLSLAAAGPGSQLVYGALAEPAKHAVLTSPAFERIARPSVNADGRRTPALRFGDPRVMVLAGALCQILLTCAGSASPGSSAGSSTPTATS